MSSGLLWLYRTRTSLFMLTSIRMPPPRGTRTLGDRGWISARSVARDTTFSFAKFTESKVQLQSGDLLVCFTDGITEPENEYGEMFGEERLMDLVARNAHRDEAEIIDIVVETVRQFARAGEAQDDMTILLARRV